MISKLELQEGMTVVDVGCGVGGPMRRVVRESGVRIVGINNSDIQLEKAKTLNDEAGLSHMIDYVACSFMDMGAMKTARSTGATPSSRPVMRRTRNARSRKSPYPETRSPVLGQDMCLTDKFDPTDSRHQAIKRDLMRGIALQDVATMAEGETRP